MAGIPKWITDAAEKEPQISVKGYQIPNGPSINFEDPLYAELYTKYISGQLEESDAAAVDEIEFLRDVANQATARLISAMQNKLAADPKKKEEAPAPKPEAKEVPKVKDIPPAKDIPVMEPKKDKKEENPGRRADDKLPEPGVSKWKESRYNERLDTWQAIVTERSVRNFHSEEEGLEYLKEA